MNVIILSIIVLGLIGIIGAAVLYMVARRFHVQEDPRIDQVEALLPGANCGGCGQSGCRAFAVACVGATTLEGLNCPSSGAEVMNKIGEIVGLTAVAAKPKIAVIKCNGTCELRPAHARFEGAPSCAVLASLGSGETACPNGCLGCGDCV
ncbi:MAG: ferredoxin, partial [Duncaniella sp.]|nr:ferredoxin [Duncaniella sp.]